MIKPVADRVLLKIEVNEETTQSGIILSPSTKEKTKVAKVISVGPGGNIDGNNVEMYIEKDNKVIISNYSGTEIQYNEEDYLIVKQSDILAVVD